MAAAEQQADLWWRLTFAILCEKLHLTTFACGLVNMHRPVQNAWSHRKLWLTCSSRVHKTPSLAACCVNVKHTSPAALLLQALHVLGHRHAQKGLQVWPGQQGSADALPELLCLCCQRPAGEKGAMREVMMALGQRTEQAAAVSRYAVHPHQPCQWSVQLQMQTFRSVVHILTAPHNTSSACALGPEGPSEKVAVITLHTSNLLCMNSFFRLHKLSPSLCHLL